MTGRKSTATGPDDDEVRALLDCDRCLRVPFHEVRTQFLANIASSVVGIANEIAEYKIHKSGAGLHPRPASAQWRCPTSTEKNVPQFTVIVTVPNEVIKLDLTANSILIFFPLPQGYGLFCQLFDPPTEAPTFLPAVAPVADPGKT